MKLVGITFIVLSAGYAGIQMALGLKQQCDLIRQILHATQVLNSEIQYNGTPLPQAFALMAASTRGIPEKVFSSVAKALDQRRWLTPAAAMEQAIGQNPELQVKQRLRETLIQLASGLGKYDKSSQLQTIELVRTSLTEQLAEAERERSIRGKTYQTLGICLGLSIAILLL